MPAKWTDLRLAKVQRISGTNGSTAADYDGKLRLFFTAREKTSSTEVAIFSIDYEIESVLSYQRTPITAVGVGQQPVVIDPGESETISGFATFRTLDVTESDIQDFFDFVAPPVAGTDSDSDGEYDVPEEYDIQDTAAGSGALTNDFDLSAISHGTGMLTDSALNSIPALDSDVSSWLNAFNYPFDANLTRASVSPTGFTIPSGLFSEFDIAVPAGDQETGDVSGLQFPVWINRIERLNDASTQLRFFFATYNVTDSAPSTAPIEFAQLDLDVDADTAGDIIAITPILDLKLESDASFQQGFGRGHVLLSSLWGGTTSTVADFFDSFAAVIASPPAVVFALSTTRLSSYSCSRVPKYIPTVGQSQALVGTGSDRDIDPSSTNRYVVEGDEGLGSEVNFSTSTVLPEALRDNPAINPVAYRATRSHALVYLVVDESQESSLDYDTDLLPRLTELFGRAPVFGDEWYDGSKFKRFNGSTWIA